VSGLDDVLDLYPAPVALAVDARRLDKQRLVYEVTLELFGYARAEAVDAIEAGRRVSGTVFGWRSRSSAAGTWHGASSGPAPPADPNTGAG
jgi:hypothetical protein